DRLTLPCPAKKFKYSLTLTAVAVGLPQDTQGIDIWTAIAPGGALPVGRRDQGARQVQRQAQTATGGVYVALGALFQRFSAEETEQIQRARRGQGTAPTDDHAAAAPEGSGAKRRRRHQFGRSSGAARTENRRPCAMISPVSARRSNRVNACRRPSRSND